MIKEIDNDSLKPKQVRRTAEDCIKAQSTVLDIVRRHKVHGQPLTYNERSTFQRHVIDGCLSYCGYSGHFRLSKAKQGQPHVVPLSIEKVTEFLRVASSESIKIRVDSSVIPVDTKELWVFFEGLLTDVFPRARAEAIHISSEIDGSYSKPTAFQFSQDAFNPGVDK